MLSELLVGLMLSQGMGEGRLAPYAEARFDADRLRLSVQGEPSRKVESGRGYRLGADAEFYGPLIVGAGYRYRNGGAWAKSGAWASVGVGDRRARLVLRRELGLNRTTSLTATLGWRHVEVQGAAYRFGGRSGATLLLGARV
jgi:hypothetical protein